jgi:undecaprenyl-diphosphatase
MQDLLPHSPRRETWLAALCLSGFVLIALAFEAGITGAFDNAGLLVFRDGPARAAIGPAWLTEAMRLISWLGDGRVLTVIGLIVLLLFLRGRAALMYLATALPASSMTSSMKLWFARPRPDIVPHLAGAGGLSFPSGHAFGSAVCYLGLALAIAPAINNARLRAGLIAAALGLSALIAFSRVWLGVHYPSDVIAGWLAGIGWALLLFAAFERFMVSAKLS